MGATATATSCWDHCSKNLDPTYALLLYVLMLITPCWRGLFIGKMAPRKAHLPFFYFLFSSGRRAKASNETIFNWDKLRGWLNCPNLHGPIPYFASLRGLLGCKCEVMKTQLKTHMNSRCLGTPKRDKPLWWFFHKVWDYGPTHWGPEFWLCDVI